MNYKQYASSLIADGIVAGAFYYGVTAANAAATNVGYFTAWLFGVITLMGLLMSSVREKMAAGYEHRAIWYRAYDVLTDIALYLFVCYQGWFVLAAVLAIGSMLKLDFVQRMEKLLRNNPPRCDDEYRKV